jgi:hypothetical protein
MNKCPWIKIVALASCLLCGCDLSELGCIEYRIASNDKEGVEEIVRWADKRIFDQPLRIRNAAGSPSVLGPRGERLSMRGADEPDFVRSRSSIILIGKIGYPPEGVFIGNRSYEGMIIARAELNSLYRVMGFPHESIESEVNPRVGCLCRNKDM